MLFRSGDINTTTEDTEGNYWFGTDNRGVIKYMPKTGEMEVYDKAHYGFASDGFESTLHKGPYQAKAPSFWDGAFAGLCCTKRCPEKGI